MNRPPLGEERIRDLKELQRRLGIHLDYETDDSSMWNEYVWSFAIQFYTLFYKHYSSFPDFAAQAEDEARNNAVEAAISVIGKKLANFRSRRAIFEENISETVSEHIRREKAASMPSLILPPTMVAAAPLMAGPTLRPPVFAPLKSLIPNAASVRRRSFVQPLLDQKGWDITEWAERAGVSRHTAKDYLEGKRRTYHTSLKSLADAIGVAFQDFPR